MNPSEDATTIYIGIDAGTSGIRACAIDASAQILSEITLPLPPPLTDRDGVRQSPAVWAKAMFEVIVELKAHIDLRQIKAMAIAMVEQPHFSA